MSSFGKQTSTLLAMRADVYRRGIKRLILMAIFPMILGIYTVFTGNNNFRLSQ